MADQNNKPNGGAFEKNMRILSLFFEDVIGRIEGIRNTDSNINIKFNLCVIMGVFENEMLISNKIYNEVKRCFVCLNELEELEESQSQELAVEPNKNLIQDCIKKYCKVLNQRFGIFNQLVNEINKFVVELEQESAVHESPLGRVTIFNEKPVSPEVSDFRDDSYSSDSGYDPKY